MSNKYKAELKQDFTLVSTFESVVPGANVDKPFNPYKVESVLKAGFRVFRTLKEGKKWKEIMEAEGAIIGEVAKI